VRGDTRPGGRVVRKEYLFRNLFDEVPIGIAVEDLDGHVLLANPALCTMLGYARDELERMSCAQFAHPGDSGDDWALFSKLRAAQIDRYAVEKRYIRKDGGPIWGRLNVSLLKHGDRPPTGVLALVEDITAHKEAEEVRSKHFAVVKSSDDAIVVTDLDGNINEWNASATKLFGYRETETLGRSISMIIPADLQDDEARIIRLLKVGVDVEEHETIRLGKNGKRLVVSLKASPVRNSAGAVVGVSATMQDLAVRKSLSKALSESEERFRKVFREAGVGMAICSLDHRIVSANNALCSFLGHSENELIGKTLRSVVEAADWALWSRWLEEGTGFHGIEGRFTHKSGRILAGETSAALIRDYDGNQLYFVCQVVDITERKRAEAALRRREEDLLEAQRVAGVGSWQWNLAEDTVSCSLECRRIIGRDPSEPRLRYGDLSRIFTAETWAKLLRISEEISNLETPLELEGQIVRLDGTTRWIAIRGELQRGPTGDPILARGTVQDITVRKRAEKELTDLSARFVAAQEEERSHLARELHDDVSQRLALMVVALDQLRNTLPGSAGRIRGALDDLFESMSTVSSDVHRLSYRLHPSTLSLGLVPALRSLCISIERQQALQIELVWHDIPDSIPSEVALCVYRVAQEALSNVVRHSGVNRARVELMGGAGRLTLRVTDLGRGFDLAARPQTGLGLLSMRERLRLVGGTLTVRSRPSQGTEVLIEVPLGRDALKCPATAGR
jgi:PAS domain S-box-containing protein